MADVLLQVRDLKTQFALKRGVVRAVDGVDLVIHRGETLGVVGESGSGKSVTAASLLRLVPAPGRIVSGEILFDGRDLLTLSAKAMAALRGRDLGLITQDPMTSLDPVFSVGYQIEETLHQHAAIGRRARTQRTLQLLRAVQLAEPERRARAVPHELSGGMRQRVVAAIALSCAPKLLIADEPTSALDATIQAQFLALLDDVKRATGAAMLIITHDLGVVARVCDTVAVMYAGKILETGTVASVLRQPGHPYTSALLNAVPSLDAESDALPFIEGTPPDPLHRPAGCPFAPRCQSARRQCQTELPPTYTVDGQLDHTARCWAHTDPQWLLEVRRAYTPRS